MRLGYFRGIPIFCFCKIGTDSSINKIMIKSPMQLQEDLQNSVLWGVRRIANISMVSHYAYNIGLDVHFVTILAPDVFVQEVHSDNLLVRPVHRWHLVLHG